MQIEEKEKNTKALDSPDLNSTVSRQQKLPFQICKNAKRQKKYSLSILNSSRKLSTISEINNSSSQTSQKQANQNTPHSRARFYSVDPSSYTFSSSSFLNLESHQQQMSLSLFSTTEQENIDEVFGDGEENDEDQEFQFAKQKDLVDGVEIVNNMDAIHQMVSPNQNNLMQSHVNSENNNKSVSAIQLGAPFNLSMQSPQNQLFIMNQLQIPNPSGRNIINYDIFQANLENHKFVTDCTEDNLL